MPAEPHLLDTNAFLRLAKRSGAEHIAIKQAVKHLLDAGANLCYTPQNVIEFWNVFTRPVERNGFGLSLAEADRETSLIEAHFTLLPDNDRIYTEWRRLVVQYGVSGVQVHDARLVAAMRVHGLKHLLTFNTGDFSRYRDIQALHPRDLIHLK